MKDLREQIGRMREELDRQEPRAGHRERFAAKLKQQTLLTGEQPNEPAGVRDSRKAGRPRVVQLYSTMMQVAAAAVLVLLAVFISSRYIGEDREAYSFLDPDLLAAEVYYSGQAAEKYEEISSYPFRNKKDRTELLQELQEMESGEEYLMEELKEYPGDERAQAALVRQWRMKIEVMDRVIMQLKQVETVINRSDENTQI